MTLHPAQFGPLASAGKTLPMFAPGAQLRAQLDPSDAGEYGYSETPNDVWKRKRADTNADTAPPETSPSRHQAHLRLGRSVPSEGVREPIAVELSNISDRYGEMHKLWDGHHRVAVAGDQQEVPIHWYGD